MSHGLVEAPRKGMALHVKVLIGFALGGIVGLMVNEFGFGDAAGIQLFTTYLAKPFGQIFLNLLFMLVVPLMFSALVLGVAELGDIAAWAGWAGRR